MEERTCYATEDNISHNVCAMQSSCDVCKSYRKAVNEQPKPDTSQVETAEEILELNTGHSIDYLRRNAFSVDDVIKAMHEYARIKRHFNKI